MSYHVLSKNKYTRATNNIVPHSCMYIYIYIYIYIFTYIYMYIFIFPQKLATLVEGRPSLCIFDFKWSEIKARDDQIPMCCYDFKLSDITAMGDGLLLASDSKQVTCGRNIGRPLLLESIERLFQISKKLDAWRRGRPIFLPQVTCFESDANNNPSPIAVISLNLKS